MALVGFAGAFVPLVSGGVVSTVHSRETVVLLPAASVARTRNV